MNKRAILSLFILLSLVSSIFFGDYAKGLVAPDQLEVNVGNSVEGTVYYTNSTVTDQVLYDVSLSVVKIIKPTDSTHNVIQFRYSFITRTGNIPDMDYGKAEFDSLVFEHNRTTLLPAARIYLENSTFSVEISIIQGNSIKDWDNINNTVITFGNGTTYRYGDMSKGDFGYEEIGMWIFVFLLLNVALYPYQIFTLYAISPQANSGDRINYYNTYTKNNDVGTVVDKPSIQDANGNQHPTIHVKYAYTTIITLEPMPEVNAYYDEETGFLLRSIETDGTETYEFVPSSIKTNTGLLPFPIVSLSISLLAIGLIAVAFRRKRFS